MRLGAIEPLAAADDPRVPLDPFLDPDLANARVPISERLFAGGRTTHRAFERDQLGILGQTLIPLDPTADPEDPDTERIETGGNGLALLNLDYRFPIAGDFGGVAFFDVGNVWADWRDADTGDLRPGVGLGLRYQSPIGPIRIEVGWKLDPEPWEDDAPVFFLSFGNPF